ncbi:MAG: exodeoxyribonuclease VII small subunit [candidate division Zixibacteria bacterium]|nr:exodeoxyribonuclease VII small subunit [candidate division Zixibacteria bacterium]
MRLNSKKSTSRKKKRNFEEALRKLEKIVLELEEGELSLEEALEKFEEGIELSRFCTQKLTQAEEKVKKLIKTAEGEFKTQPLDMEAGE